MTNYELALAEQNRLLREALRDCVAAISVGMVLAQKTPGAFDQMQVFQIASAKARKALGV